MGGRLDAEYNYALLTKKPESEYPMRTLRSVASHKSGGTPPKGEEAYWDGDLPWVSPKDFDTFYLSSTEDYITQQAVTDSTTSVAPKGSLLMVVRSGVLQHSLPVAIAERPVAINQDVKAITFSGEVIPDYAGCFFTVFADRLLPLITKSGATVQSVNTEQLEKLEIPVPPRKVQHKITQDWQKTLQRKKDKLGAARRLLASTDEVLLDRLGIELPEETTDTIEHRMFVRPFSRMTAGRFDASSNWRQLDLSGGKYPVRPFSEVVAINPSVSLGHLSEEKEVTFVPMEGVSDRYGEIKDASETRPVAESDGYTYFSENDILWAKITPSMENGKSAVASNLVNKVGFGSTEFHVFRPRESALKVDFLHALLRLEVLREHAALYFSGAAGHQRVDTAFFEKLKIPVPPIEDQRFIARELDGMRRRAKTMVAEASQQLEEAKTEVETLILNGEL
jgi:type I restriction enzyme S subunit